MSETYQRRVLGPNGMTLKTFTKKTEQLVETPSKSQEEVTVTPTEKKPEPSTEPSTPVVSIELIRAMEPQELRVLAKENKLKIGNVKDKVKMQDKVIKLLKLEDEAEAL